MIPKRNNTYIFSFGHEADVRHVLDNRTWSINNQLLAMREWPPEIPFDELNFLSTPIWTQVHRLPPNQLNMLNAQIIGNFIGIFLEVDLAQEGCIGIPLFLRLRVSLDLSKPLPTDFQNKRLDGTTHWVSFRFEKLPDFCYSCEIIGYLKKNCHQKMLLDEGETNREGKHFLGPRLEAPILFKNQNATLKQTNKSTVNPTPHTPIERRSSPPPTNTAIIVNSAVIEPVFRPNPQQNRSFQTLSVTPKALTKQL